MWKAPRPGYWVRDDVHWPRPVSPFIGEFFPVGLRKGIRQGSRWTGAPLDYLDAVAVNGAMYLAPVILGASPSRLGPSSGHGQRLLYWLHPAVLHRSWIASSVFKRRPWRGALERWQHVVRPAVTHANRELSSLLRGGMCEAELSEYLDACRDNYISMVACHQSFTLMVLIPVGDYLAHAGQWTGLEVDHLVRLLRRKPTHAVELSADLSKAVSAIKADPVSAALLASSTQPKAILDALATAVATREAVSEYVSTTGSRIAGGYDITDSTLGELPGLIIASFRRTCRERASCEHHDQEELDLTASVRTKVPKDQRQCFDDLLNEARTVLAFREERALYTSLWATGIARLAVLAAGKRLWESKRLSEPELLLEAKFSEMQAYLSSAEDPIAAKMDQRRIARREGFTSEPPHHLGEGPLVIPTGVLPKGSARVAEAIAAAFNALLNTAALSEHHSGVGASPGICEGVARCIGSLADLTHVQPGEILVMQSTSGSLDVILPTLGALVTEKGGVLCHAATLAREFGIPAVVGLKDAISVIPNGSWVKVDGTRGEVVVLSDD